jgi:acyl carrier protein
MNIQIRSHIQEIFRDVFDDPTLLINSETNSDQIPDWDSLAHLSLVTSIERHFKIKFALGELQTLKNVGEMVSLIEKKLE